MDGVTAEYGPAGEGPAGEGPAEEGPDGEGSPHLALAGFSGPLHHLLSLARAQKIDLMDISLVALADQLTAALTRATEPAREGTTPLNRKGDWVVMTAWLVQLRSLLLLPADAPGRQDAAAEADQLRSHLARLQEMQALAGWLERRPQLGRDVFGRGRPDVPVEAGPAIDVVEFLWASMALFDVAAGPETDKIYQPCLFPELYAVTEAHARILQRLAELPDGGPLAALLPQTGSATGSDLRRRSAWSSTLAASLELAKQGGVTLAQDAAFQPIHVAPA